MADADEDVRSEDRPHRLASRSGARSYSLHHGLTVAIRYCGDFDKAGVAVHNAWAVERITYRHYDVDRFVVIETGAFGRGYKSGNPCLCSPLVADLLWTGIVGPESG